jgi:hypothetical protein
MPEGPEVDLDKLKETIDEEIEREGGQLLRAIALSTAILAALAAVASLKAGGTVNEALALKTEAGRLQTQASDQWAYYQAKGLKAAITEGEKNSWTALDKPPPETLGKNQERYANDQETSKKKAEEFEKERDEKDSEADHLMHRHHYFAQSVALLQVSIALGAVAALTRKRLVWIGSALLGLIGAGVFGYAFVA